VNLVSSPGSGKTTLLTRTLAALAGRLDVAVIEGDQQTSVDADRIRATGARACRSTPARAATSTRAWSARARRARPPRRQRLIIENVGNLVCPAAFDLGEHRRTRS
jgi:hydrogenase nickel incorporation protein HypB